MSTRIGLIGLGLMGSGFTKRLIATGHAVTGYDPDAARTEAAVRLGISAAASAAEVAQAADRADIHDRARALPDHLGQQHLAGDEDAGEVDVELAAEFVDRHLDGPAGDRAADVVQQHVEAAELLQRVRRHRRDRSEVGHVGLEHERLALLLADQARCFARRRRIEIDHDDLRTLACEQHRRRSPVAPARTH